ncbi:MAG: Stk1 family PASTA domain-containing Ser/Thr kinase [Clostridiales bacterium]|nr:Stk1 family PASTA domain-containing Ser/Thr kinase [Clostridiales bacterium]
MDKYTGKRLDGRYEIHELIGVGGMALVYRAYDTIDDRTVAIKIMKDEFLGNEEFIRRFKNESKAIAVLSHPNIVKVYDVSFGDRIQYIVEEYIDGITLKEYLDQQKEIKWKEAIHFTVQILRALQHAHEKGVVHRDIKPQNIMLLQDGTIKVTDFGIARFSRSETRTMTDKAIGSVHYIAPEQARGDITDEKADLYSVGVMLYEMLTGRLPFEADNAVSVAIMQLQADPKPPREINPAIPEGLEQITLKAMQKNPAQRYQSAAQMLNDIEEFRRNPSISFQYKYFVDENPTKYVDAINSVKNAESAAYNDNYEYEEDLDTSKPKKKKSVAIIAGIAAAFLIVAIGFGVAALIRSFNAQPSDVSLPNFVGKTLTNVQKQYSSQFTFETETKYDSSQDAGIILSQTPKAGTTVKANSKVTLVVNGGGEPVVVPDLSNKTQEEAESELLKLDLPYKIEPVQDDTVKKGYVKSTNPPQGTQAVKGTTLITVYVSSGSSDEQVNVPSVFGMTLSDAKTQILAKGLTVGTVTSKDDSGKPKDTVLETDPLPGVPLAKGSVVNLVVSSGKYSERTAEVVVQLPSVSNEVTLNAYLGNEPMKNYTDVSLKPVYNPDYTILVTGTSGKKTITVELDGNKYAVYTVNFDSATPVVTKTAGYEYEPPASSSSSSASSASITPAPSVTQ